MSSPHDDSSAWSDTRRAEAFSDGVFAIVITLLVLDLKPPQTPPGHLVDGLLRQWPNYLAYLTSYLYVAVVWLNHKHAFMRIRAMSRGLHWANLGILFTTALLPFPTAVLSNSMQTGLRWDVQVAIGLYSLIGVLLCGSWLVFFRYLHHHPRLLAEDVKPEFFQQETTRAWTGIILYGVAAAVGATAGPPLALAILLAIPIFYGYTSFGLRELVCVLRRS